MDMRLNITVIFPRIHKLPSQNNEGSGARDKNNLQAAFSRTEYGGIFLRIKTIYKTNI